MGACQDTDAHPELKARSKAIDKKLRRAQRLNKTVIKILLLGSGESGKSTIFKQMKILHQQDGFTKKDREFYRDIIRQNSIESMQALCEACNELHIPFDNDDNRLLADALLMLDGRTLTFTPEIIQMELLKKLNLTRYTKLLHENGICDLSTLVGFTRRDLEELGYGFSVGDANNLLIAAKQKLREPVQQLNPRSHIQTLWQDSAVQCAFSRRSEFHLLDSAEYWFNNLDDIYQFGYLPSDLHILHSRTATMGIVKMKFQYEQIDFEMFDVGGQRGERKKWIHCFDGVTAILFIAALSEYDQRLVECHDYRNRMTEAILLFDGVINLPWFRTTPVILFLNKDDIFRDKVMRVDMGHYHPGYRGGRNYANAIDFIRQRYFDCAKDQDKTIYCHVVTAIDTSKVDFVWRATKHILQESEVGRIGLL